jgi:hypothetical protein
MVDLVDLVVVVHITVLREFHNNQHQTLVLPNMDMLVVMEKIEVLLAAVVLVVLVKMEVQEIQMHLRDTVDKVFNFRQHLEILFQR